MNPTESQMCVEGLREWHKESISLIYEECYPIINNYLLEHGGSEEDVKQTFRETMVIAFDKVRDTDFELTIQCSQFLLAISQKIWTRKREKMNKQPDKLKINPLQMESKDNAWEEHERDSLRRQILRNCLSKLSPDYQMALGLRFEGKSYQEIASLLPPEPDSKSIRTESYVRLLIHRCKKTIKKCAEQDLLYSELAG